MQSGGYSQSVLADHFCGSSAVLGDGAGFAT